MKQLVMSAYVVDRDLDTGRETALTEIETVISSAGDQLFVGVGFYALCESSARDLATRILTVNGDGIGK